MDNIIKFTMPFQAPAMSAGIGYFYVLLPESSTNKKCIDTFLNLV